MRKSLILVSLVAILSTAISWSDLSSTSFESPGQKNYLRNAITGNLTRNQFPDSIQIQNGVKSENFKIEYTLNKEMQNEAESLLKKYKPDYGAVFMFDVKTGEVLAMSSWQKSNSKADNWNLKATFPAASIFKIVTASAAVDYAGFTPDRKIAFNGGNYTLHKRNVLSEQINKWTRFVTLKEAFAKSLNTAFGRLTLENLDSKSLALYADRYMFNKNIETDFTFQQSTAYIPEGNDFKLTQAASGFNRENTLSPIHGAMIASTIVNDGSIVVPYIVKQVTSEEGKIVYKTINEDNPLGRTTFPVISKLSSKKIKQMMEQTVLTGTSRKAFKKILKDKRFKEIEMGGKTGHLTGKNPQGRTDWFVGYATDNENSTVALAAITVNIKKWTVKSSSLGEMMFRKFFRNTLDDKSSSMVSR